MHLYAYHPHKQFHAINTWGQSQHQSTQSVPHQWHPEKEKPNHYSFPTQIFLWKRQKYLFMIWWLPVNHFCLLVPCYHPDAISTHEHMCHQAGVVWGFVKIEDKQWFKALQGVLSPFTEQVAYIYHEKFQFYPHKVHRNFNLFYFQLRNVVNGQVVVFL